MIDFSEWEINSFRSYGGANGNKLCMIHNNEPYMVKVINAKEDPSVNSCINEYIGCNIFQLIGIKAQETILGKYKIHQRDDFAVACKDFNVHGYRLQEFLNVKNTCIDSSENGKGTSLIGTLCAIEEQKMVSKNELKEFFWDMFIADAFIGNFDRHNGNWGILSNEELMTHEIAPIYDCGSCLYARATIKDMKEILTNKTLQEQRLFEFPTSAFKDSSGKKINYFNYISSGANQDCTNALQRITSKIDMKRITQFIKGITVIPEIQREFYCTMLKLRKERILDFSLEKLVSNAKAEINIENEVLQKSHKRENAIIEQNLPTDGIAGQYQELYRNMILAKGNEIERYSFNSVIDVKIAARMLAEGKYNKSKIRQVIIDYSPKAVIDPQYVDKIMTKAKDPKYKKETIKKYGYNR